MTGTSEPVILIIEDSDEDFESFCRIARKSQVNHLIFRCIEGDEVLPFLRSTNSCLEKAVPFPSLIILDLNLPGLDGRELLKRIKQDETFKQIPVIVWTTSVNPKDIEICYKHGANSYLLKPMDINLLNETIQGLINFWLKIALLPHQET
jgi:CheY-like chemotaxis protein